MFSINPDPIAFSLDSNIDIHRSKEKRDPDTDPELSVNPFCNTWACVTIVADHDMSSSEVSWWDCNKTAVTPYFPLLSHQPGSGLFLLSDCQIPWSFVGCYSFLSPSVESRVEQRRYVLYDMQTFPFADRLNQSLTYGALNRRRQGSIAWIGLIFTQGR